VIYTRIISRIHSVPGITDIPTLTVNGGTGNIAVAKSAVAVPGTITVTSPWTVDDQIIRLPDAYAKDPDSVIYRLLHLNAADREEILAVLDQIQAWRSLDDAEGAALDMIGHDLGLPRGGMSDIEYRRRLRLRVATILSSGEIERFNEILDALMGRAFIGLQEGWTDVPVWDYHFDGSLRFDAEVQVFDAGDLAPSDLQNRPRSSSGATSTPSTRVSRRCSTGPGPRIGLRTSSRR